MALGRRGLSLATGERVMTLAPNAPFWILVAALYGMWIVGAIIVWRVK